MNKVLVTGCAGFIGSHFCRLLLKKGHSIIGVDNFDAFYPRKVKEKNLEPLLKNPDFIFYEKDILTGLGEIADKDIDIVVHLAAKAGVRPSIADPAGYINININGTQKLHEFIVQRAIKKFIFASSSSLYGNNKKIPFNEEDNVDNPISPYAYTKKAGELMNYTLHHMYNIDVINLRFFTVYGPGQRPDLAIHKFVKQICNNEPIVLYGDGSTARDYTYIDDTVSGIYSAMQYCMSNDNVYEIFNLGNNKPVKLKDLVENIYDILGAEKNIIYSDMQPGDVEITYADISRAQNRLNYSPETNIKTGLKNFIDWYRDENGLKDRTS